jgi:antitoxin component YwqK of YwqJK toxin-antitoxin module
MPKAPKAPRIDRVDFYRLREYDFLHAVHAAIAASMGKSPDKAWAKLTPAQQGAFAFSPLISEQLNGGLAQFFYNLGDGPVPPLVKLLKQAGAPELAQALADAQKVYRKHAKDFKTKEPFGEDGLFARMEEPFKKHDKAFERYGGRAAKAVEKWIRANVDKVLADQDGKPIDPTYSGEVETLHPNGLAYQQATLKRGVLSGPYRRYSADGTLEHAGYYKGGEVSADFWPTGQPKRKKSKQGKLTVFEWFYESGKPHKRLVVDKSEEAVEPVVVWHENGQVAEELHLKPGTGKKLGPWRKFFEDGRPMLRAEYKAGQRLVVHDAWDESGKQIVKDGAGTFFQDGRNIDWQYDIHFDGGWSHRTQLKNGIPHGVQETYHHGVLWSRTEMKDGKAHGESLLFYDDGKVRTRTILKDGKEVKSEELARFTRPKPAVLLFAEADDRLYKAWGIPPLEVYPTPLNLEEVQSTLEVPPFLQQVYEKNLAGEVDADDYESWDTFEDGSAYFVTVDESGDVADVTWSGASAYSGQVIEVYPPHLSKLKFRPGRRAGKPVECRVVVRVEHTFVEGG